MKTRALLALLLSGCAHGPNAWTYVNAPATWETDAGVIEQSARDTMRPALPWGGTVTVYPDRFPCCLGPTGGTCGTCSGQSVGDWAIKVAQGADALSSALAWEFCNNILCRDFDCSETRTPACTLVVTAEARKRLGR